ncbi:MAG: DUF5683 domain-containing protein [Cyclobacteriaceae bacterium]
MTGINQDTTIIRIDSAQLKNLAKPIDDPLKAALLSAVLPGLGQAYNGSYWKIPIIYAGFVGLGSAIHFLNYQYVGFRNALSAEVDGDPNTINPYAAFGVGERVLNLRVEFYRRNRDFTMILTGLFYFLQIVEANVDGHLKTFDISDEISLNLDPHIGQLAQNYHLGLSLKLNLK